jgi:magnesium chelatase family protein
MPGSRKATHSCKCGLGSPSGGHGPCGRAPRCLQTYQGRVSGPLLDRIDLQVEVPPVTAADLALPSPAEGTAEAAARVAAARELQSGRGDQLNSRLEGEALETIATPDEPGRALLTRAAEAAALTARGWVRTLRLARTIADLDGSTAVRRLHVAEALSYRRTLPGAVETSAMAKGLMRIGGRG